jgi:magnesium transporter
MSAELAAVALLNERFFTDYPLEAARALEAMPTSAIVAAMLARSPVAQSRTWQALSADRAADVLEALSVDAAQQLLGTADTHAAIAALAHLALPKRDTLLAALPASVATELRTQMQYGSDTAGSLMDPRIGALSVQLTVGEAIERLRSLRQRGLRELFVVDDQMQLAGMVETEDLALTGRERPIREITRQVATVVRATDPVARVAQVLQAHPVSALPVVGDTGRFLGVIRQLSLLTATQRAGGKRWFR